MTDHQQPPPPPSSSSNVHQDTNFSSAGTITTRLMSYRTTGRDPVLGDAKSVHQRDFKRERR